VILHFIYKTKPAPDLVHLSYDFLESRVPLRFRLLRLEPALTNFNLSIIAERRFRIRPSRVKVLHFDCCFFSIGIGPPAGQTFPISVAHTPCGRLTAI